MRESGNRVGSILLGIAVTLIVLWVLVHLVVLSGPARIAVADAKRELGATSQFMALFPDWFDDVAADREWSLYVTRYRFAAVLVACAVWTFLAVLLMARYRYAVAATFAFIGFLVLHSIVFQKVVAEGRLADAFPLDSVALYLLLVVLLTRSSVVALFRDASA